MLDDNDDMKFWAGDLGVLNFYNHPLASKRIIWSLYRGRSRNFKRAI